MEEPFVSQMMFWSANFAPRGWAYCNGQLLAISSNNALFSLIGTTYGGDGRTTFALPDLRGRVPIGAGHGPGLSNHALGSRGGLEAVRLHQSELPSHTHGISQLSAHMKASSALGTYPIPNEDTNTLGALNIPRISGATLYSNRTLDINLRGAGLSGEIAHVGGDEAHDNRQPYLTVNHIIALLGIYPSRS